MRNWLRIGLILAGVALLPAATATAEDLIRFKSGRTISGRIVSETPTEVTLEIPDGGRLTVSRSEIKEILKNVNRDRLETPSVTGVLRSEHCFVWTGKRRLGSRTFVVRKESADRILLEEESVFTDDEGKDDVRVRIVERVTAAYEPVEIIYRETSKNGAILLRGVIAGDALEIAVSLPGERTTSSLAVPEGMRFPLSAREFAVRERDRIKVLEVPVFDPREENFYKYRFENLGKRRVTWDGSAIEVDVVERRRGQRAREEIWIDGTGQCLTEEMNGSAVVAVLSTRERVKAFREGASVDPTSEEERVRPQFLHAEAGFRLTKPNLSWVFERMPPGDRKVLTVSNIRYFAYLEVYILPGVPEGEDLSGLAAEMAKRFADHSEDFKKLSEGYLEVGGAKAYRMVASSRNKDERLRSLLVGCLHGGKTWQIAMSCPEEYFDAALPEFEAILTSLEFID